jgi:hypothetical protein
MTRYVKKRYNASRHSENSEGKTTMKKRATLVAGLFGAPLAGCATTVWKTDPNSAAPKMTMTTGIPASITTPDSSLVAMRHALREVGAVDGTASGRSSLDAKVP